jgi:hypothetical protein
VSAPFQDFKLNFYKDQILGCQFSGGVNFENVMSVVWPGNFFSTMGKY